MAKTKGFNAIDAHVDSRLHMRRIERGMTQEKLAAAFGADVPAGTKYEKRMNRMGASRLQHAAGVLGVPVSYFFEGGADGPFNSASDVSSSYVDDFVASEDGLRLAKAFMGTQPALQRRIAALVTEIAGERGE